MANPTFIAGPTSGPDAPCTTLLPSPVDARTWSVTDLATGAEHELAVAPGGPFAAIVFKTVVDRFQGLLSVFRVVSGTIQHDTAIVNATTGTRQRLGKLHLLRGHDHVEVPEAGPGDVVAVAKLKDVHTGHALTSTRWDVSRLQLRGKVLSQTLGLELAQ